ncbi:MAG: hypothetical protein QGM46_06890 [Actinomycetota bacterium]|nr:hypothetical protein [Actinomycetota bacterium]MDK1017016.1 hypothetical protein [Actinomycetota bacterium]MDK1026804.1 hypothetical protein [Actinomycetota bacterium]MDK1039112.1 hypothetical protein [Actinomycetota bacterium]MDK1097133.1 hypothetical protein [Actinomycetota bacterium]
MTVPKPIRAITAVIALTAFVIGIWIGLTRIGWAFGSPPAPGTHGAIIVLGFLGTVIGMERAVAMNRTWAWITPLASAGSVIAMLTGAPSELAGALLLVGGVVLVGLFGVAYRIQPEAHIVMMGIGAGAWVLAAGTWLAGGAIPSLTPWLAAFLVLTIAGERLELARIIATTDTEKRRLAGAVAVVLLGSVLSWATLETGVRIAGFGNLLVALWLIRYDIARRTIRLGGVTRYMASGLLVGYGWLAVSGVLWIVSGLSRTSVAYDAALHTLFLGFVISMIMAHAPIVIPALAGLPFPFTPAFWAPLAFLQVSILIRVAGGLAGNFELRRWGAMLNAVALGLFLLMVIGTVIRGQRTKYVARIT